MNREQAFRYFETLQALPNAQEYETFYGLQTEIIPKYEEPNETWGQAGKGRRWVRRVKHTEQLQWRHPSYRSNREYEYPDRPTTSTVSQLPYHGGWNQRRASA